MNDFAFTYEVPLRLGLFAIVFLLVGAWERFAPRRQRSIYQRMRWTNNRKRPAKSSCVAA